MFASVIPGWRLLLGAGFGGHTTTEWLSFLLFWGLNVFIIYRGMDLLRMVENWAAPFVLVMTAALLVWAVQRANGLVPLLQQGGKYRTLAEFLPVFGPSLTAMVGYWATPSINIPDFTRFGRSQREQIVGQVVALPTTMAVFAAMGVIITSATVVIYGHAIWDPNGQLMVDLVPQLKLVIGEQPPVPELPPRDRQARFELVVRRLLGAFARPGLPLVLFLDDLQGCEPRPSRSPRHLAGGPPCPAGRRLSRE